MTISIIIPAYNVEKYLDDCLSSCYRQDIPVSDYEIIIVNDGSVDKTLEIAERWAAGKDNIRIVSQTNRGLSEARNAGIAIAKGDYIMFLDSDDLIADMTLGAIVNNCICYQPDMVRFCAADMIGNGLKRRFSYEDKGISAGKDLLKEEFQVCAPFAVYRKSFLEDNELRFLPGVFHEDNEFTPRAYYLAKKVISIDRTVYLVRQTPGSITRTPDPKRGKDLIKVIELLTDFAENQVDAAHRPYIYKQISDCINRCLNLACRLSETDSARLCQDIADRKLLHLMLESSRLSHRIEGRLMLLFPKKMKFIYGILDSIHR